MKTLLSLILLLALPLVACSTDVEAGGPDALTDMTVEGTHNVACGCKLESIGHCGNYIEVDGKYIAVANSEALGLGPMEWCKHDGPVEATATGTVTDGEFVGTAIETN